jgi:phosphoribosyl 1,2-cyclic phosphodiesterase
MRVRLWGTRGSLAAPGPETARFGGNTACVEVGGADGTILLLDAGTGIRRAGMHLPPSLHRVNILLSHLHLDHIQGLGFFPPLYDPEIEVHVWGPGGFKQDLGTRLSRYLSPPLFPVHLRSLPCSLTLHEVPRGEFVVDGFRVTSDFVCHPGLTVGYRIEQEGLVLTYLPDHEPALGVPDFPLSPEWTSGYSLAEGSDLLIHDAQYSDDEYSQHVGWGHSSIRQSLSFAGHVRARHLVLFHHDPGHGDEALEQLIVEILDEMRPSFTVTPAAEEAVFEL